MKTYSNRGNCIRAARSKLGKDAKVGSEFTISGAGNQWTFAATGSKKTGGARAKRRLRDQPQNVKTIKMMAREGGATVKQIAAALGGVEEHTVRGSVSRLRKEVTISVARTDGIVHYSVDPKVLDE